MNKAAHEVKHLIRCLARLCLPVALLSLIPGPVFAAACAPAYTNKNAFVITDEGGGFGLGLVAAGAVGAGMAAAATTTNGGKLQELERAMMIRSSSLGTLDTKNTLTSASWPFSGEQCPISVRVETNKLILRGVGTLLRQDFVVEKSLGGVVKTITITQASFIKLVPWALKPARRYELDRSGKYVEVTAPVEGKEERFDRFYLMFLAASGQNLQKVLQKAAKIN